MADLKKMMDTAGRQLFLYPEITDGERLKRLVRRLVLRQKQAPIDPFSWPNAMLAGGLLTAFAGSGQQQGLLDAAAYLEQWGRKKYRIHSVDNVMNGALALWIEGLLEPQDGGENAAGSAEEGGNRDLAGSGRQKSAEAGRDSLIGRAAKAFGGKRGGVRTACRDAQEACAQWLRRAPRTSDGILAYRPQHPDWIFADTVGMVCPFLCRYGALKRDEALFRLGALQLLRFLEKGMDAQSGLPYHGYHEKTGVKYGAVGWGRACGWLLKGMAESLPWLEKKAVEETWKDAAGGISGGMSEAGSDGFAGGISDPAKEAASGWPGSRAAFETIYGAYRALIRAVLRCQRTDGGFSWLLPAREGNRDSSAEGMIGAAISLGLRCGLLGDRAGRYGVPGGSPGGCRSGGQQALSENGQLDPDAVEMSLQLLYAALERSVDGGLVQDCSGECRGFGEYPQVYGWYPWGQGSVLDFFGAEEWRNG